MMSLYCNFYDIFLMIRQWLWVLWKMITEGSCHFHHIISKAYTINMIYDIEVGPFSSLKSCTLLPLSVLYLLEEITMWSPYLRSSYASSVWFCFYQIKAICPWYRACPFAIGTVNLLRYFQRAGKRSLFSEEKLQ